MVKVQIVNSIPLVGIWGEFFVLLILRKRACPTQVTTGFHRAFACTGENVPSLAAVGSVVVSFPTDSGQDSSSIPESFLSTTESRFPSTSSPFWSESNQEWSFYSTTDFQLPSPQRENFSQCHAASDTDANGFPSVWSGFDTNLQPLQESFDIENFTASLPIAGTSIFLTAMSHSSHSTVFVDDEDHGDAFDVHNHSKMQEISQ